MKGSRISGSVQFEATEGAPTVAELIAQFETMTGEHGIPASAQVNSVSVQPSSSTGQWSTYVYWSTTL